MSHTHPVIHAHLESLQQELFDTSVGKDQQLTSENAGGNLVNTQSQSFTKQESIPMNTTKSRAIEELKQLQEKIIKLDAFINATPINQTYRDLLPGPRMRLGMQLNAMKQYAVILSERIDQDLM